MHGFAEKFHRCGGEEDSVYRKMDSNRSAKLGAQLRYTKKSQRQSG